MLDILVVLGAALLGAVAGYLLRGPTGSGNPLDVVAFTYALADLERARLGGMTLQPAEIAPPAMTAEDRAIAAADALAANEEREATIQRGMIRLRTEYEDAGEEVPSDDDLRVEVVNALDFGTFDRGMATTAGDERE